MTGITKRGIARILETPLPKSIEPSVERIPCLRFFFGPSVPKWTRNGRWSKCGTWLVNNRNEIIYP